MLGIWKELRESVNSPSDDSKTIEITEEDDLKSWSMVLGTYREGPVLSESPTCCLATTRTLPVPTGIAMTPDLIASDREHRRARNSSERDSGRHQAKIPQRSYPPIMQLALNCLGIDIGLGPMLGQ